MSERGLTIRGRGVTVRGRGLSFVEGRVAISGTGMVISRKGVNIINRKGVDVISRKGVDILSRRRVDILSGMGVAMSITELIIA